MTTDGEWHKHLRKWFRRSFWKRERLAESNEIADQVADADAEDSTSNSSVRAAKNEVDPKNCIT